jgi:hypothetical protein
VRGLLLGLQPRRSGRYLLEHQPRRSERYLLGFHPPSDDNAKVLRPVELLVVVPNLTTKDYYQFIY